MSDNPLSAMIREAIREEIAPLLSGHPDGAPRLMDRSAVAAYLGVHPATVDNLRARGALPTPIPLITGGRKVKPMWDRRDIDACIESLKQTA